jgi:pentatricopeptide repeat protein
MFEMLKEQPFYQPKEATYMKLLVLLGRCGQPQRAHQIFDEMIEEGIEPTSEFYTALLAAYCRKQSYRGGFLNYKPDEDCPSLPA